MSKTLLIVDDHEPSVRLLRRALARESFDLVTALSPDEGLRLVKDLPVDAVLTDLRMPGLDGLEFLKRTHEIRPGCDVVVMTGHASVDTARAALEAGASDYITKPISIEGELRPLLRKLVCGEGGEVETGPAPKREVSLVGVSRSFQSTVSKARRLARSNAPILLCGESGTGKDVFANFIHVLSERRQEPMISVNCAAVPEALLESEMFGHVRGSFSGALSDRTGFFQAADGGTLFLDEIGELPLALQPKLLHVLQTGSFYRVGDAGRIQTADVRIITATNRDLDSAVEDGTFRRDLFYRLGVLPLVIPPLRDRREDVSVLVDHFLEILKPSSGLHFSDEAMAVMLRYDWPGNVREVSNTVEHAVVLAEGECLEMGVDLLPPRMTRSSVSAATPKAPPTSDTLQRSEIDQILHAMRETGFNRTRAAALLGITRRKLQYRIDKYDLRSQLYEA